MEDVFDFTKKLAVEAGKTLLGYYQAGGIAQGIKEDSTVLTEADLAADRLLRRRIHETFPQDGLLSEEENTIYPAGKRFVWVIDPLDGTTNFSLGLHYWGVLISRLEKGVPALAVLYFPLLDELFSAVKGQGAFLNGRRLQVGLQTPTRTETFFSCCSRTHRQYRVKVPYKTRILGAAGYGLSTIARGSAALALEVTPKVWDFSASWLLTEEAGGMIAPLDGEAVFPLQPGIDYRSRSIPILAASTKEKWDFGKQRLHPREKEPL